jgi:hypothetical protein
LIFWAFKELRHVAQLFYAIFRKSCANSQNTHKINNLRGFIHKVMVKNAKNNLYQTEFSENVCEIRR